jgi:hypothetical protein
LLIRRYVRITIGTAMKPIPTNISSTPSGCQMVLELAPCWLEGFERRTTDMEMRGILRTIDVRGDGPTKVSDADVDCHADSALVLPCQVISKPIPITRLIFG